MIQINRKLNFFALGLSCVLVLSGSGLVHSDALKTAHSDVTQGLVLMIDHLGNSKQLQRPPVAFNHDQHTRALDSRTRHLTGCLFLLRIQYCLNSNHDLSNIYTRPLFPVLSIDERIHKFCQNHLHEQHQVEYICFEQK